MAAHVFVSYVHEDAARVDDLCQILDAAKIPVWRDTASLWPGVDWRLKIRGAIRSGALVFLACFSAHSAGRAKSYQNEELVLAIDEVRLRRPDQPWLIPVRFDDCLIPGYEIGGGRMLTDLQQVDLFGPVKSQNADRLVAAIREIIDAAPDHGPASPATGPANRTPGPASPGQHANYVVNLDGARGVQLGDHNIQHNSF